MRAAYNLKPAPTAVRIANDGPKDDCEVAGSAVMPEPATGPALVPAREALARRQALLLAHLVDGDAIFLLHRGGGEIVEGPHAFIGERR